MSNNNTNGPGRNMSSYGDLADVTLPSNAGKSRDVGDIGVNDTRAQHTAAATLAYSLHAAKCTVCSSAQDEGSLCPVGRTIYSELRSLGVVE